MNNVHLRRDFIPFIDPATEFRRGRMASVFNLFGMELITIISLILPINL
jgi:hypothetical protein